MAEESNSKPEHQDQICETNINHHILPLRDRITRVETTLEWHDREFDEIKVGMKDLGEKVELSHQNMIDTMEKHHKNTLDVLYSHIREGDKLTKDILEQVNDNRTMFNTFITKWRTASWAIWLTLTIAVGSITWGLKVAHDAGLLKFTTQDISTLQSYAYPLGE